MILKILENIRNRVFFFNFGIKLNNFYGKMQALILIWLGFFGIFGIFCSNVNPVINNFKGTILQTLWCGPSINPTLLILSQYGEIFRSIDFGVSFQKIQESGTSQNPDPRTILAKFLEKSPSDESLVFFIGISNEIWVSESCGEYFQSFMIMGDIIDFKPHPIEKSWVLMSTMGTCKREEVKGINCKNLYLSKRMGYNFKQIKDKVIDFSWGVEDLTYLENIPISRIYVTLYNGESRLERAKWSEAIDLYFSDNFFKNQTLALRSGNRFLLKEKRLFAVKVLDETTQEVKLYISKAHKKNLEMKPVDLPVKHLTQFSYSILDITKESIILHIKHQGIELPIGNIYVLNRKTLICSLSLLNNVMNLNGHPQFEKIQGIPGVYLANILEHEKAENLEKEFSKNPGSSSLSYKILEKYIRTYITYDYGGQWHLIAMKENCVGECGLNLNLKTFSEKGPLYSKSNALGLVLGTGNIGNYLSHRQINTFFSLDGGNEWSQLSKGSHIYDFGDHGGLIVIALNDIETDLISYSWNSGKSWENIFLSEKMKVLNIMTEEDNRGLHFLIIVQQNDSETRIIALDFNGFNKKPCIKGSEIGNEDSDYELWSPWHSKHCLLGERTVFVKRKAERDCVNGMEFERLYQTETCACTEEDWECDKGFYRKKGSCERKEFVDDFEKQKENCQDFIVIRSGYRQIPGTRCSGGLQYRARLIKCSENNEKIGEKRGFSLKNEYYLLFLVGFFLFLAIWKKEWLKKKLKFVDKIAKEDYKGGEEENRPINDEGL